PLINMIGDLALDAMEHQVRSFRMANTQHHESLQEVLRKYEVLVEDYRRLKSDFEEERDGRERYKKQARGHEKNPFALVLIDGDGYIFSRELLSAGPQGGAQAAHLLRAELTNIVAKLGQPDKCEVLVRIYCNVDGLFNTLGEEAAQIMPFMSAFNGAEPFFEFVDVYDGTSESASRKVEETFFLFAESTQCRHILFAGCHDARYMPLLSPHLGRSDRVTLLTAGKFAPEYQSLGLAQVELGPIFRGGNPAPTGDPLTIKGAAKNRTQSQSSASRPTATTTPLARTCKFGNKCKFAHPRRNSGVPDGHVADDWGNAAPPSSWAPQVNTVQFGPAREEPPTNGAFTTAAHLPRPSPETEGLIPLNKDRCRLDFYLPRPSHFELQQYRDSINASGKKHCNEFQLKGQCSNTIAGKDCAYDHAPLKQEFFHILKYIVSARPCSFGSECRVGQCYYGHVCQRPSCEIKGCRF
ncbi:uncharacterized protein IWZ02DRAFT_354975, partial [Phyllosticta citriasiana]